MKMAMELEVRSMVLLNLDIHPRTDTQAADPDIPKDQCILILNQDIHPEPLDIPKVGEDFPREVLDIAMVDLDSEDPAHISAATQVLVF